MINRQMIKNQVSEETKPKVSAHSFLELFRKRLSQTPDHEVFRFVQAAGETDLPVSYRQIDERAKSIARYLKRKTTEGDRIGLLYAHSPEFIFTYVGCLYAGCIPVPLNIPFRRQAVKRMRAILEDSGMNMILTTRKLFRYLWFSFLFKKVKLVDSSRLKKPARNFVYPEPDAGDLALLQYTSGSTGRPKGVMVSHSHMLANLEQIAAATHIKPGLKTVSWLPSFHDMGFIAGYMLPIWANSQSILMSPLDFLKNPTAWVKLIDRYKAEATFLPNFGLGMAAAKVPENELESIDLSCFDQVYCGSEPIRKNTIDRFVQHFEKAGFQEDSIYPCYGMAETVLMATVAEKGGSLSNISVSTEELKKGIITEVKQGQSGSTVLYSCGRPWGDTEIAIVNPDTRQQKAPHEIGEIWLRGSIVTGGYWKQEELNTRVFDAELRDTGQKGYLRTGDLGAYIDGHLYVTGRLKDLIIIRGRNFYPHDIETILEGLDPALRINNCAVFSVEGEDTEKVVVLQEIRKKFEQGVDAEHLCQQIRARVSAEFKIAVHAIGLIPQGSLPKTTSGKIQRNQCKEKFSAGKFKYLYYWEQTPFRTVGSNNEAQDSLEAFLQNLVAAKTGHPLADIDPGEKLVNYGLDSLTAVEITDELERHTGLSLSSNLLWEKETIRDICDYIHDL